MWHYLSFYWDWVFIHRIGNYKQISNKERVIYKLKKEIEPFATRFLESASGEYAKSYKMLSQMMEHSSIKITLDLYSHLTEETVKTEIDKFSNYMDRMVFA